MSEIRANTVSDAAGTGPVTLTGQSAAKAWVSVSQEGTTSVLESLNISSLTDNGVGETLVTLSNSMASANYGVTLGGKGQSTVRTFVTMGSDSTGDQTSSSHPLIAYAESTGSFDDLPYINSSIFGDLA